MKDIKFGKQNLSAFSQAETIQHNGKRGVFIPIEPNFLTEARNGCVYVDLVGFKDRKIPPYTHNICVSVPEEFRGKENRKIGGWKLE